jgi:hypothetical protein
MADWDPWKARNQCFDEAQARRFERAAGRWPSSTTVIARFDSWNAAIIAAGYQPRRAISRGTRAATNTRRSEIRRLWLRGASAREIAEDLGSTAKSIGVEITRMRRDGWDLPYRGRAAA